MENALGKLNKSTPVIGVIAEYDPFHNGHVLHLAKARETLKHAGTTVPVVVTLSSSFTQRGLPAFADKTARAKMALAGGVNLVLELPFVHACNSGPEFARGAVGIMAAARFVTHLAFGAENASVFSQKNEDEPFLDNLLRILIQEPFSFKSNLRENLASGCSYPKALALALERERPGSHNIVSSPNNALAVSYLAEIQREGYELIPIPVQREGGAHNDEAPGLFGGFAGLAGAAAIRKSLSGRDSADWVKDAVPDSVMSILTEEKDMGRLCSSTGKLWDQLRGLLARSTPGALRACAGMDEGLENLFLKHYARADSYEDFIGRCVCARYTRGRLQRQAARCLAGLDRETAAALSRSAPPYIRVLGYDELGRELLRERKKRGDAAVPIITRLPAAGQKGGAMAKKTADAEFRASRLRELLLPNPDLTREERLIPCRKS